MAEESGDERGFLAEQPLKPLRKGKNSDDKPHYSGHRQRLRERFRDAGSSAVTNYEILEMLLFRSIPRADTKERAKALLKVSVRLRRCSARRNI